MTPVKWEATAVVARVKDTKGRVLVLEAERSSNPDVEWRWRAFTSEGYRYGMASTLPQAMAQAETAAGLR